MKALLFLLSTMLIVSASNAQKVPEKKVPQPVRAALQKQYPEAKNVTWEKEDGNYEAGFEKEETEYSVLISGSGSIVEIEIEIDVEALPAKAKEYISQKYYGAKIKEVAKITDSKGGITYEAEVKGKDLIFDNNGNFIKG